MCLAHILLNEWWMYFTLNFNRLLNNHDTLLLGVLITIINNTKILLSMHIIKNINSSFLGIATSISNPISIIIWYFIDPISTGRLIFELLGTIIIIYGFIKYSKKI